MYPKRPLLRASETEYLLCIHPNDRHRVKAIGHWKWDPVKKVWRFPKERRYFEAIIAEFGDDLQIDTDVTSSQAPPKPVAEVQYEELPRGKGIDELIECKAEVKSLERDLKSKRRDSCRQSNCQAI